MRSIKMQMFLIWKGRNDLEKVPYWEEGMGKNTQWRGCREPGVRRRIQMGWQAKPCTV